ncbi:MAG: hypothetical protein Q8881_03260, partial [Sweet potato little leaf phytoplasma]|nr:hypothetical protein [Sweet potato little leaf phytoplasma]
ILRGEKIDLFKWSLDAEKLIINALKPAQVDQINLDFDNKNALLYFKLGISKVDKMVNEMPSKVMNYCVVYNMYI